MPDEQLRYLLNLKVAKDRKGMPPNRPLLLLTLLDLVEAGAEQGVRPYLWSAEPKTE